MQTKPLGDGLVQALKSLRPTIEEILGISGTVGLSYGVLHEGRLLHQDSFGWRDAEQKLPVNEETIFPLCSVSKAIVGTGLGILVNDESNKLAWDSKISDVLPEFRTRSEELHSSATLLDYLSMRTGMQTHNTWLQSQNNIIISPADAMTVLNSFQQVQPLRKAWQYDNWAYEIGSRMLEKVGGDGWGPFLSTRIFQQLGMGRTRSDPERLDQVNVARAYAVYDDATPVRVHDVCVSDRTLMGGSGGVSSCVDDMLKFYKAFLAAWTDQLSNKRSWTPGSPFQQLIPLTTGHADIPIPEDSPQSYCVGWTKGQLPARIGIISSNFSKLGTDAPRLGVDAAPMTFLNHAGSMVGAMTSALLFPESETAVIVLTNTLGLSDTADTVTQLLVETIFDMPQKHDFVDVTRKIRDLELQSMVKVAEELEKNRNQGTKPRPLQEYTGRYQNDIKTMIIDVALHGDRLQMQFQQLDNEKYALHHHEHDTFNWWMSRNECSSRGRFTNYSAEHYLIRFMTDEKGKIGSLYWKNVPQLAEAEVFSKVVA